MHYLTFKTWVTEYFLLADTVILSWLDKATAALDKKKVKNFKTVEISFIISNKVIWIIIVILPWIIDRSADKNEINRRKKKKKQGLYSQTPVDKPM